MKEKIFYLTIIVFPLLFWGLEVIDSDRGLIWFVIQQIYYLPLGVWLTEPFFKPDSEIYFKVLLPGRIIAPLLYIGFIIGLKHIIVKTRGSRKSDNLRENL